MPYVSPNHESNYRQCTNVAVYWNLSIIAKLFLVSFFDGINPSNINDDPTKDPAKDNSSDPYIYAILNFALCLVCDIVP